MIKITNQKVAGYDPRWSSFSGFSLLFDNPGDSLSSVGGFRQMTCQIHSEPTLLLYQALRIGLEKIGIDELTNQYLFCPLDPLSYHVTVWDGINNDNIRDVKSEYQTETRSYLEGFPKTFSREEQFHETILQSPLVTNLNWTIHFKLETVIKWENRALGAFLTPADENSKKKLDRIAQERQKLYDGFEEKFGVGPSIVFRPHVTLGYFANIHLAEQTSPLFDQWVETIQKTVGEVTITFNSLSLYGFTDMITFFKQGGKE